MTDAPGRVGTAREDALEVRGLAKRFGSTVALAGVDLTVRRGTVHALLGGNGSGKSTTIKILAGVYQADAGTLRVMGAGHPLHGYTGHEARAAGLRFVHQDLALFPGLSVAENFALDAGYPRAGTAIRWSSLHRRVADVLREYELDVDPRTPVDVLSPPDRTMVAIARALRDQDGAELVLVLDEPTASLAFHESELLLRKIRRRAERGQTVLLVSHRLQEVIGVADDYTVFRDGTVAGALTGVVPTEDELIALMAGRAVGALHASGAPARAGDELMSLTDVHCGPLRGLTLRLDRGEVVGVAGLVGSGRTTLLKTMFGERRPESGTITYAGSPYAPGGVAGAMAGGIALVPEDRARDAAFPDLPIRDNLSMSVIGRYKTLFGMPRGRERRAANRLIAQFGIRADDPDLPFSSMSGGNQQKTIIARWLQRDPKLLLLDEPTQGVDVMSRADIYRTIRASVAAGCTAVVASSDVTELCALCDRVVVLRDGRIATELAGPALDSDHLTTLLLRSTPRSRTPSSQAPSSQAPSSEAPSSEAPSSEAPSSEAPSFQTPSSQSARSDEPHA